MGVEAPHTPPRAPILLRRVPVPPPLAPLSPISTSLSLSFSTSSSSSSSLAGSALHTQLTDLLRRSDTSDATLRPPARTPKPLPTPLSFPPCRSIAFATPAGSPTQLPASTHEAMQAGASSPFEDPSSWSIPFSSPPRGSTFFISGSGTRRLGGSGRTTARPPLPIPPSITPKGPPLRTAQVAPSFKPHTAYSPPSRPGALPAGAQPLPLPGRPSVITSSYPTATTKVPLATSSSILLHAGFWDLLAATGSKFYGPQQRVGIANGPPTPWSPASTAFDPFAREMGATVEVTSSSPAAGATEATVAKKKKRISVDMVGEPQQFQHAVHASDADQAEALMLRWHADRQGKVGNPAWAQPIKEAVRAAHRAAGVAEAQYARDEALDDGSGLKVVNGLPDSVIKEDQQDVSVATAAAVEDEHLEPPSSPFASPAGNTSSESLVLRPLPSPPIPGQTPRQELLNPFVSGGTTRFSPQAFFRPGAPLSFDRPGALQPPASPPVASPSSASDPTNPFALPSSFVPSLVTIERAASTKIALETKYYALLKQPKSREMRKALLEKELARLPLSDQQRMQVREAWKLSETEYLREMRDRVGVGSFAHVAQIGRGAFGVVSLVKERTTGQVYAMKQLRKADMLKKSQEGHVRSERDLLAAAASSTRWTVPLAYSFQDQDHLYLVMSYMAGGDLLSLLIEKDTFPEAMARFYLAEIVLAVEETHKVLGALHRDIKPDNFLFDEHGHLAIADFGLAQDFAFFHDGAYYEQHRRELLNKHGIDIEDGSKGTMRRKAGAAPFDPPRPENDNEAGPPSVLGWRDRHRRKLAYSLVGTSNYMAVEVLRGTGYSTGADWWSIGVIAFEMLYGYPPFVSKSRQETKQKILQWRSALRFPSRPRISRQAQDFITSLICEPEHRLGARRRTNNQRPNSVIVQKRSGFLSSTGIGSLSGVGEDGAEELKSHPFFRGIDWNSIHLQKPPFQPDLRGDPTCTRYFDDDIPAEPLPAPELAPGVPAPDTTRDPLLKHPIEGQNLLALRKQQAFSGWTFKRPKRQVYDLRKGRIDVEGVFGKKAPEGERDGRGRGANRSEGPGNPGALSTVTLIHVDI
ncbi:hypothetical protein JCM11251_006018 [Rhodosporidiobolus azoricus]